MKKLPEPIFFTDRDLGKQFPNILRSAGLNVETHAEHFADDTTDVMWLNSIGQKGWVAITHDKNIGRKPNELYAVNENGVGLIVIVGHAPFRELATNFVETYPKIIRFIQRHKRPFIAKVYRPSPSTKKRRNIGEIKLWRDFGQS